MAEVTLRIQVRVRLPIIAIHVLSHTVVGDCIRVTGDVHDNVETIDRQPTIRHFERHVEVVVRITELASLQTHRVSTDGRTLSHAVARIGEVSIRVVQSF